QWTSTRCLARMVSGAHNFQRKDAKAWKDARDERLRGGWSEKCNGRDGFRLSAMFAGGAEMDETTRRFEELIKSNRGAATSDEWRGTFLDYLEKVKVDPPLSKLAHARLHDLIMSKGVREIPESENKTSLIEGTNKIYNFFAEEFFGIEKVI